MVNPAASNKFNKVVLCYARSYVASAIYGKISSPGNREVKANVGGLLVAKFRTPKLISRYSSAV